MKNPKINPEDGVLLMNGEPVKARQGGVLRFVSYCVKDDTLWEAYTTAEPAANSAKARSKSAPLPKELTRWERLFGHDAQYLRAIFADDLTDAQVAAAQAA